MNKILSLLLLLQAATAFAQDADSAKLFEARLSLNYNAYLHYFGRTDSVQSSGVFPLAELWFGGRYYINAAPVFVHDNRTYYAGTVATAGYQYSNERWINGVYLTKPFYTPEARLVQSALKAQAGVSFTRLTPALNLTAGADVKFSDRTDIGLTAGIDHLVRRELPGGRVLVLDPSLYFYGGTQRFTQTYTRKKEGSPFLPARNEEVTEEVSRVQLLSWEAAVPVVYAQGSWQASITPSYVAPKNLLPGEVGRQAFYVTAGLKWTW